MIVPKFEELALSQVYKKSIGKFKELKKYMPDYEEADYKPPRQFFWNVFYTVYPEIVERLIKASHEMRMITEETNEKELIRIRADILDTIENASFISSNILV